jgi:hypothetical protein
MIIRGYRPFLVATALLLLCSAVPWGAPAPALAQSQQFQSPSQPSPSQSSPSPSQNRPTLSRSEKQQLREEARQYRDEAFQLAFWSQGFAGVSQTGPAVQLASFGGGFPAGIGAAAAPALIYGGGLGIGLNFLSFLLLNRAADLLDDIAQDPPDPNFTVIAQPIVLPISPITAPPGTSPELADAWNAWLANLAQQEALLRAFLRSLERAQGANAAGNVQFQVLQTQTAGQYALQLAALFDLQPGLRLNLESALLAQGAPPLFAPGSLVPFPFTLTLSDRITRQLVTAQNFRQIAADLGVVGASFPPPLPPVLLVLPPPPPPPPPPVPAVLPPGPPLPGQGPFPADAVPSSGSGATPTPTPTSGPTTQPTGSGTP